MHNDDHDAAADRAVELLERAAEAAGAGRRAEAGALALDAAALLPSDDPERMDTLVFAAQLFAAEGRHVEAADAWAQAAGIAENAGDAATRARALNAVGQSARLAGQWQRATDAHTHALELAGKTFGENSIETAAVAQNLAVVFKYTGRFDEAKVLYLRALAIAEAAGDRRVEATICHNLGGLGHARGDHADGIPWARRSVEVRAQLEDPDPVAVAADRGALAGLLIDAGQLEEAHNLLRAARATFVEHHGADHHEVGVVDGNLATIALARGDLAGAEEHARAALAIKERHLGEDHPELAVTLTTLGTIRRRRGDPRRAVLFHRRARSVLAAAVEPDHPLLRTIEENLAVAVDEANSASRRRRRR